MSEVTKEEIAAVLTGTLNADWSVDRAGRTGAFITSESRERAVNKLWKLILSTTPPEREAGKESSDGWRPIADAPLNTAVLTYGFDYDVAHYNTAIKAWVACWDHRKIGMPTCWAPLLPAPPLPKEAK